MGIWGRTGVVERARGCLGVDVGGYPASARVHGGEASANFVPYMQLPIVIAITGWF